MERRVDRVGLSVDARRADCVAGEALPDKGGGPGALPGRVPGPSPRPPQDDRPAQPGYRVRFRGEAPDARSRRGRLRG
jgi:hypothetical protein